MSRCPVVCVWQDGESVRCTISEAEEIVIDDLGEWDGRKTVRMKPINRSGGQTQLARRCAARRRSAAESALGASCAHRDPTEEEHLRLKRPLLYH